MIDELTQRRIKQLRKYAEWEELYGPDGKKKTHICTWAAGQIEALYEENEQLRQRLAPVQHGYQPILDKARAGKPPRPPRRD